MNTNTKIALCFVALAGSFAAFTTATLVANGKDEVARIDLVLVDGKVPCVVTSKAGLPTSISCKWDHIVVQPEGGPEKSKKPEWRL